MELHESYRSLTPREREVMVLVVSGLLNKQVGGELGISEITVKAHRGPGDAEDEGRIAARAGPHGGRPRPAHRAVRFDPDTNVSIPSANGVAVASLVSFACRNEPVPTYRRVS